VHAGEALLFKKCFQLLQVRLDAVWCLIIVAAPVSNETKLKLVRKVIQQKLSFVPKFARYVFIVGMILGLSKLNI